MESPIVNIIKALKLNVICLTNNKFLWYICWYKYASTVFWDAWTVLYWKHRKVMESAQKAPCSKHALAWIPFIINVCVILLKSIIWWSFPGMGGFILWAFEA